MEIDGYITRELTNRELRSKWGRQPTLIITTLRRLNEKSRAKGETRKHAFVARDIPNSEHPLTGQNITLMAMAADSIACCYQDSDVKRKFETKGDCCICLEKPKDNFCVCDQCYAVVCSQCSVKRDYGFIKKCWTEGEYTTRDGGVQFTEKYQGMIKCPCCRSATLNTEIQYPDRVIEAMTRTEGLPGAGIAKVTLNDMGLTMITDFTLRGRGYRCRICDFTGSVTTVRRWDCGKCPRIHIGCVECYGLWKSRQELAAQLVGSDFARIINSLSVEDMFAE